MIVQLRRYTCGDKPAVEQFQVTSAQAAFVEPLRETLAMGGDRDCYVIEADGEPVGFFQIDHASSMQSVETYLELHEVIIDWRHQGKKYGKAFVEILPGKDGLVHISELSTERVPSVEDVVSVGDELEVMVVEIDRMGRVNLSRRAVIEGLTASDVATSAGSDRNGDTGPRGGRDRGRDRDRSRDRGRR